MAWQVMLHSMHTQVQHIQPHVYVPAHVLNSNFQCARTLKWQYAAYWLPSQEHTRHLVTLPGVAAGAGATAAAVGLPTGLPPTVLLALRPPCGALPAQSGAQLGPTPVAAAWGLVAAVPLLMGTAAAGGGLVGDFTAAAAAAAGAAARSATPPRCSMMDAAIAAASCASSVWSTPGAVAGATGGLMLPLLLLLCTGEEGLDQAPVVAAATPPLTSQGSSHVTVYWPTPAEALGCGCGCIGGWCCGGSGGGSGSCGCGCCGRPVFSCTAKC